MAVSNTAVASITPFAQVQPLTAVSAPSSPTLAANGSGNTLPPGTYYVKITYVYSITYNGRTYSQETTPSGEVSQAVSSGQQLVITSPSWPAGVTAVNVYVSSSAGQEKYQGQITSSGGSLNITAPLQAGLNSPSTTNFPNGNNTPPATATTAQIIYQAPATNGNVSAPSATAIIKEIVATNTNTSAGANNWLSLYIVPPGQVAGPQNAYMFYQTNIGAMDSKPLSGLDKFMVPGSTIQALQQTAGMVTLDISGLEVQ